ncbi:hypothetical protein [Lysobacter enzymogenes]|uniref:hypothetical protein n=1 Tax=Lysobacter enzymogenes TaxID=69 RepID=UPI001A96EB0C|nr:hypothetical protein [Lysobacter enzymogenes]QQP96462.1 hypothetical protein JHW38_25250 [Lysobacter enzymogenes]QQP96496.1 hypothetical protein JHW38_00100 [Lysobacter enzymogenes]
MADRPSPRFHRDDGSERINALRRDFEHWYVGAAFDYTANPIGSQNCDLQWRAWLASRDAAAPDGAQSERGAFYVCPTCHGVGNVTRETYDRTLAQPEGAQGIDYNIRTSAGLNNACAKMHMAEGQGASDALYELAVKHGAPEATAAGFAHTVNNAMIALHEQALDRPVTTPPQPTEAARDREDAAAKFGAFAVEILNLDADWIGDVDGGMLQDAAVKHGLLDPVEVAEPCGEGCNCSAYGEFPHECFRPTPIMQAAIDAARAAGGGGE